jgi:hypothetical protein
MRSRGRLLQRFQERVGGRVIQSVRLLYEKKACAPFERAVVCFALNLAQRLYADDSVIWTNHSHVSVFAPYNLLLVLVFGSVGGEGRAPDAQARGAMVAGFDALGRAAVHGLRQLKRKEALADAALAYEKQRARHAPARQHATKHVFDPRVSQQFLEHKNL